MEIRILNKDPLLDYRQSAKVTLGIFLKENDWQPKDLEKFWVKQICAMHSIIRGIHFRIIDEIPKSVASQLVRHTDGHPQPEMQSSRPDWTGKERSNDPYELRLLEIDFTPESFIKMAQKRLCKKTEERTLKVVKSWVEEMKKSDDPLIRAIARCSKPKCDWYLSCNEIKPCGKYSTMLYERF